nr:MAG TPA: hypothetical protein [Caudoviricetes sp.]
MRSQGWVLKRAEKGCRPSPLLSKADSKLAINPLY